MTLDVRTMVVMLVPTSMLMAMTFAVGVRGGRDHAFGKWNLGLGMYALGWLLIAARGTLPDVLTMAASNGLLLSGLCFQLAAVVEFGGRRASAILLVAPGPVLFVVTLPLMANYTAFTVTASAAVCTALFAIAIRALRLGTPAGAARWMLAGTYALGAVALLARSASLVTYPEATSGLFTQSAAHGFAFLGLFAATCAGSSAFLLMLNTRAESEIRHLAMFDSLTEVFNRRAFMDLAERELARARRTNSRVSVLMLDLDHFKSVNDTFGHQAGDLVIAAFATTTKGCLRSGDLLGRYGGEEFCAILADTDLQQALEIADRIRAGVEERPLGNLPRATTVSIGVATCSPTDTLERAIGMADEALYCAKRAGRNRVADERFGSAPGRVPTLVTMPASGRPAWNARPLATLSS
jgi:diguanylate cyclase (GGDEF)-like protein